MNNPDIDLQVLHQNVICDYNAQKKWHKSLEDVSKSLKLPPHWMQVKNGIEGDGNCFFGSIQDQLAIHSLEISHKDLCKIAVDCIGNYTQVCIPLLNVELSYK